MAFELPQNVVTDTNLTNQKRNGFQWTHMKQKSGAFFLHGKVVEHNDRRDDAVRQWHRLRLDLFVEQSSRFRARTRKMFQIQICRMEFSS